MIGKMKKIQGRKVDIPEAIDDNKPLSVDRASRVSIYRHLTVSMDAHHQQRSPSAIMVYKCFKIYLLLYRVYLE